MTNRPLISIIVPIYNTANYLHKCIDSILAQTYTNFELLLIDDGSTDESGNICDEYALQDKRIVVFHKENGGVSSARNFGMDCAHGEWISFIDSDDYVGINYISSLHESQYKNNSDFVIMGLTRIKDNDCTTIDIKDILLKRLEFNYIFSNLNIIRHGYVSTRLFNTNIIRSNKIRFNTEIRLAEDLIFVLHYILKCNVISVIERSCYFYQYREGSLTNSISPYRNCLVTLKEYESIINIIQREFCLTNESNININLGKLFLLERVISSITFIKGIKKKARILSSIDLNIYYKFKKHNTFNERLLVTILKMRLFYIYALIVDIKYGFGFKKKNIIRN